MIKRLLLLNLFIALFISAGNAGSNSDTTGFQQADTTDVLSALTARIKDTDVHINWRITNPKDISYFEILRKDSKSKDYISINKDETVKKNDNIENYTDENNRKVLKFNYVDKPEKDGVYYYKVKAFDSKNNVIFISDEIKIGISGIKDFKLDQNHPNPFNPTTTIKYELFEETHVTLKVYDLIGKEITTLVDETQPKGDYTVEFDSSRYSNLTSGIYFYKLTTDKYTDVRKMILTK
jgi:hypothetical protein